jgi:hypothetical protein
VDKFGDRLRNSQTSAFSHRASSQLLDENVCRDLEKLGKPLGALLMARFALTTSDT